MHRTPGDCSRRAEVSRGVICKWLPQREINAMQACAVGTWEEQTASLCRYDFTSWTTFACETSFFVWTVLGKGIELSFRVWFFSINEGREP